LAAGCAIVICAGLLAAQIRKPEMKPVDSKEAIARGQIVYKAHCEICHYAASTQKKVGPGLKGLPGRAKFADGTKNDAQTLTHLIEIGGKDMPPFRAELSDAQIRDLLAYLRTL
jgi:cytochrome c